MTASPGELSAALANEIVALMADYTGRGSPKSRCYIHENLIVCVLHDSLTKGELSLVNDGKEEAVLAIRRTYQESMRTELIEIVERLTGRKVSAFMRLSQNPVVLSGAAGFWSGFRGMWLCPGVLTE